MSLTYEKDPEAIYRASFSTVRAEADLSALPESLYPVAIRMIHACGMTDIAPDLSFGGDVVGAAREAIGRGASVLCDCEMVRAGISACRLKNSSVIVTLNDERTPDLANKLGTTRSAAAVELWRDRIDGALVVIGNAPTALFHLLERFDDGWPKPAAVFAFPVGFVGAAESKAALAADPRGVPYLTLLGRRGGSAMAAAALNAVSVGLDGGGS